MGIVITGGNDAKAERIAHELVRGLSISDIDFTIAEGIGLAGEQRLCAAVDDDFKKNEIRIAVLDRLIDASISKKAAKLMEERDDLLLYASHARQKGCFLLGFAAAQRLMGFDRSKPQPTTKRKRG